MLPPAEAPLEMLPPISGGVRRRGHDAAHPGGAPTRARPEAEIDGAAGTASSGDSGSTAVLNEGAAEERPTDSEPAARRASGRRRSRADRITSRQRCDGAEPNRRRSQPRRAGGSRPSDRRGSREPAGRASQASPPPGDRRRPRRPAAAPPRPPKQGGQGKSESSRSRSSRPRHGPPPPPEPPRPHPADAQLAQLAYVVVNEAGASVYSTSQVGRDELPDLDATLRSGISIGRRLQDPLAELVKIEPQNIGVGLYQHDVNPKQLKETLESVIASCVNFVGVDLNTASVPLLRHVSGLNQLTARRIVDYRKEHGPFTSRDQLTQVEGIGPATFTQAAGFLKIPDGEHPLDRTWIHPESYPAAIKLLGEAGVRSRGRARQGPPARAERKAGQGRSGRAVARAGSGRVHAPRHHRCPGAPERDPREDLPKPIFKKGILKIEDLTAGMELKGTVLNVVDFGAFVDIGLKDSGLVHISQLANRYVKSPHDVVSVGDVVTVWVMGVDHERKRVSLTMVKPGTERQRGQQGGGVAGAAARASLVKGIVTIAGKARGDAEAVGRGRTASAATGGLGIDVAPGGCSLGGRACRDAGEPAARPRPRRPAGRRGRSAVLRQSRTGRGPGSGPPGHGGGPPRHGHGPGFRSAGARRPARPLSRAQGPAIRSSSGSRAWSTSSRSPISAIAPASSIVQRCPGRQCPAPDVWSAQAALGSESRAESRSVAGFRRRGAGVIAQASTVPPRLRPRRSTDPKPRAQRPPLPRRPIRRVPRASSNGQAGRSALCQNRSIRYNSQNRALPILPADLELPIGLALPGTNH